jgi:hypothetical protein
MDYCPYGNLGGNRSAIPRETAMKKQKPHWEMTAAELREATKQFDDPAHQPPSLRPTTKDQEQQRRARRKGGRPRKGLGAKTISLTVEKGLLSRSDSYAKRLGISRAELFQRGLQSILPAKETPRKRAG